MTRALDDAPQVAVASAQDLRQWLTDHHAQINGVWLVTFKKGHPDYLSWPDIVDQLLCFGWVDSLPRAKDDTRTMLYISPRRPDSNWSRVNKDKIARLDAAGLMAPAGHLAVDRARENGRWTALDQVEDLVIPPDLQAGFDASPGAEVLWHAFPRSVKRGALEMLLNAKRRNTRQARVATIVTQSAQNRRPFMTPKT